MEYLIPSVPALLVLRALEDNPAHGYAIAQWVHEHSEGVLHLKEGTLYPLLRQLEKQGLVESEWTDPAKGRPAKVYHLTQSGTNRLAEDRQAWEKRVPAVSKIVLRQEVNHGLV